MEHPPAQTPVYGLHTMGKLIAQCHAGMSLSCAKHGQTEDCGRPRGWPPMHRRSFAHNHGAQADQHGRSHRARMRSHGGLLCKWLATLTDLPHSLMHATIDIRRVCLSAKTAGKSLRLNGSATDLDGSRMSPDDDANMAAGCADVFARAFVQCTRSYARARSDRHA